MTRPTVKVVKSRYQGETETVRIYVAGPDPGQGMRLFVSVGGDGILRYSLEHEENVEDINAGAERVDKVRWDQ